MVKVQETADNLKELLGAKNDVTFTSELPGQAEADSMTACGETKTGEKFVIACNYDFKSGAAAKEVVYYDDADLKVFSDLVILYQDKFFAEAFGVFSDNGGALPEPAAWAMMVAGFGLAGAGLRRTRRRLA
jgi:hypothetical protein